MSQYDNTNRGGLFKNDKQGKENRPDYKGSIDIRGEEFWLSAWIKTSTKDGSKFMSLSVEPKQKQVQDVVAPQQQSFESIEDGTIPF